MKIATWNVNSVRARLPRLVDWLRRHEPEIVCLQETKVDDLKFPRAELEDAGYNVETFGEPTYNGVAILSHEVLEDPVRGLPGDDARRLLAGVIGDLIVVNVYVPNGKDVRHPDYEHKLQWLSRLRRFLDQRYPPDEKLVLCGDFNVAPDDRDVYDPEALRERILCSTREREALRAVMQFGLHDAARKFSDEPGQYTWWDYRGGSLQRDLGLRIDLLLMTGPALAACTGVVVDREERAGSAPSDHAPVIAELE